MADSDRMMRFARGPLPDHVVYSDGSRLDLSEDEARTVQAVLETSNAVSPEEAAGILGVSRPMVVRWIDQGLLEDMRAGTHHRIPMRSIQRLIQARADAGRAALARVGAFRSEGHSDSRVEAAMRRAENHIKNR